jgi:ribosomal protein L29
MKTTYFTLLLFAGLLPGIATAQMGGQMGRGQMGSGQLGRDQTMGSDVKKKAPDQLEMMVDRLKKELTLDSFQEAVIRSSIKNQMDKVAGLRTDSTMGNAEKQDKASDIAKKTDDEIKAVLNKEQLEKYEAFKIQIRSGKKKKGSDKDAKTEEHKVPDLIENPE